MSSLSRLRTSPGLLVRALVALGAVAALVAAAGAYVSGRAALGVDVAEEAVVLAIAGALARRFGIALPGNGFSSYILGVLVYATLDRGWPFAVVVGPVAMLAGDVALGWLAVAHAHLDTTGFVVIGAGLAVATVMSGSVIRRGVRADELGLIQELSQAIARDISLAKSFPRIQELARRLVPWEHMGFARYDAATNEMELIADTAAGHRGPDKVRFDANAGLSGEAVRRRRPVVAGALSPEQVVVPGRETPGSEVLVPLYHAGQLVGLWSVRHSNPGMYRDADGDMLALLAPQLALMLAIEGSVQPVVGASDRTTAYIQTLTATAEEIHASSQEVAASARRASQGAAQAASLVSALARDSEQLTHHAAEMVTAGTQTRDSGAQMEQTTEKVRLATQTAVRRLTELGVTTEESAREVGRLRDVAEQVGKSAQETRRALDRAAQLLERVRGDLGDVVRSSSDWVQDLTRIAEAAGGTARAGKQVAELAQGISERAARISQSLEQAKTGAHSSTQEAEAVAAAAAEQLQAIEGLAHGATELAALADNLAKAVRFVRGENGRQ